jgi:hypothetical protein
MPEGFVREKIDNWVSDFLGGDAARRFGGPIVEYAQEVLGEFLAAACDVRGVGPEDVEEADLRAALLGRAAAIELPKSVREQVPDLCAAFLEDLQAAGRLGGGRSLGVFVRALRGPFLQSSGSTRKPERRVAPKLGPNEPCPCGSGKKFKRCCQVR